MDIPTFVFGVLTGWAGLCAALIVIVMRSGPSGDDPTDSAGA